MCHLSCGETLDAAAGADEAAAAARSQGLKGYSARALVVSASAHLALGDSDGAIRRSTAAISLRDELGGLEESEADLFVVHAEALRRSGRAAEATETLARGKLRIEELAARITDPVWRDRFLRGPSAHRQLVGG
jgi:hypothetical protein